MFICEISIISGVALIFEHSPNRASEVDYFEIFSRPQEDQLAQPFSVKFNLLLLFLTSYCWECFMHIQMNTSIMTVFLKTKQSFTICTT